MSGANVKQSGRSQHITFIALSGDSQPHFTTIAGFVSTLGDDIARIFTQILFICDKQGLIGREMFAIDGVKLPSSASKAKSGIPQNAYSFKHLVEQTVQRVLEGAGQQLPLQVDGKKLGAGVDVFVARHLFLQNIVPDFDLDIYFGSRHDVQMNRLFLQLR